MDAADVEKLRAAVNRLADVAERLENMPTSSATNTVTVAGHGVVLSLIAAGVMFGMNLALLVMLSGHDRKIDDLTHYLQAIYIQAPHLQPPEE